MDSTILVIEDEGSIRSILTTFLELLGYKVVQAENGQVGLNLFKNQTVDLIITDINMPVMSGADFIAAITDLPHPPPVIALCGDASEVPASPLIREIISKPVSIHRLKGVVEQILGSTSP